MGSRPESSDTTYVVRVTNASVAVRVAYPGRSSALGFDGFGGKTIPPTATSTANLTIHVDKETDRPTRAVMRYWNPPVSEDGDPGDAAGYRSPTTYRFSDHGSVDVDRPLGTYPPCHGPSSTGSTSACTRSGRGTSNASSFQSLQ